MCVRAHARSRQTIEQCSVRSVYLLVEEHKSVKVSHTFVVMTALPMLAVWDRRLCESVVFARVHERRGYEKRSASNLSVSLLPHPLVII